MPSETIAAAFDTPEQAEALGRDLRDAGIAGAAIRIHVQPAGSAAPSAAHRGGFWAWLFGTRDAARAAHGASYDRAMERGGAVVTVIVDAAEASRIVGLMERHGPAELEETASVYDPEHADTSAMTSGATGAGLMGSGMVGAMGGATGAARVRRYPGEHAVEEQIRLRDEHAPLL